MLFLPKQTGLVSACAFNFEAKRHQVLILTMGRLTEDDGQTPNKELEKMVKNGWRHMPTLAPEGKMVVSWKKGRITWSTFVVAYLKKLANDQATKEAVAEIIELARDYQVVITCVETTAERCHRKILLLWCKLLAPDITITVL